MTRKYEEYTRQELDVLSYCYPMYKFMWAVNIMSKILDCDFKDSETVYRQMIKDFYERKND